MRKRSDFSPAQCRAARALLGWSQERLAERVGLSVELVAAFEAGEPLLSDGQLGNLGWALNYYGGVIAIPPRLGGEGVRFALPTDSAPD